MPNVSLCTQENEVHYNQIVPPSRVILATLNIETTSNPTVLTYEDSWANVESVVVTRPNGTTFELSYEDLVQYDPRGYDDPTMGYQFDTVGNHTIEYTLKPNVTALNSVNTVFDCNYNVTSATIPNCITSIGTLTFSVCEQLSSVVIPDSVTYMGDDMVFMTCPNLTSVTIFATIPPENNGPFDNIIPNIYVPAESVDAYKAAEGWSYYASKIQAIPTT